MKRLLALALVAACAAACSPAPEPDTRRFGLYRAMRSCLADPAGKGCTLVDRARGFVVIEDDDPAKPLAWLLVPDVEVTGIEDPRVLEPPVVEFWRHGWMVGETLLPGRRLALAINSEGGRTQDLLHVHISCLDPRVAEALAATPVGPGWTTALTLDGHAYHARRAAALAPSPFLLLQELPGAGDDMGAQSLAVTAARGGGFLLLAEAASDADAEELLDEACR
jgi:CDP-diacylglycerol pyrophosphatase